MTHDEFILRIKLLGWEHEPAISTCAFEGYMRPIGDNPTKLYVYPLSDTVSIWMAPDCYGGQLTLEEGLKIILRGLSDET